MADEPTQACTLAIEPELDDDSDKKDGWAMLKSLNPAYTDFILSDQEVVIGRNPVSTLHFNDMNVSGKHCVIKKDNDSLGPIIAFLYDHSTNGTYVDGIKVGKGSKCLLSSGQEIALVQAKKQGQEKIAFIYQPIEKEEEEDGGPQKKYHIGETLGTGNFAAVKLAVDKKTGAKYAMKIIDKKRSSSMRKDALMDEVNILKSLNHPNIIHIQEVFNTEKTLYLALELVEGGELLHDILANAFYNEEKSKILFKQIVNAVKYLHDQGIAHRDLKPENILLKHKKVDLNDQSTIKLSDFGLSRTIGDGSFMKTMCGTPMYCAPEILTNGNGVGGYGKEVDCWSMGAILYVMMCGYPPFEDSRERSIFDQIRNAVFEFPEEDWKTVSPEAKDLVKRLLNPNPTKRYSCDQILDHPWYNNNKKLETLLEQDKLSTSQTDNSKFLGKRKSEECLDKSMANNTNNSGTNGENNNEDEDTIDEIIETSVLKKSKSNNSTPLIATTTTTTTSSNNNNNNNNQNNTSDNSMGNGDDSDTDEETDQIFDLKPISPIRQKSADLRAQNQNNQNNHHQNNIISNSPDTSPQLSSSKPFVVPAPKQPSTSTSPSSPSSPSQTSSNGTDNRPMCKYGVKCYRINPKHLEEFRHPPKPA